MILLLLLGSMITLEIILRYDRQSERKEKENKPQSAAHPPTCSECAGTGDGWSAVAPGRYPGAGRRRDSGNRAAKSRKHTADG